MDEVASPLSPALQVDVPPASANVEQIPAVRAPGSDPTVDAEVQQFSDPIAKAKNAVEIKKLEAELEAFKSDIAMRQAVARRVFWVVIAWLFIVVGIVYCQGVAFAPYFHKEGLAIKFNLNDNVLIALLATTTLNVIGLLLAVIQYLFPKKPG